jgi:hypothetical protein
MNSKAGRLEFSQAALEGNHILLEMILSFSQA